MAISLLATHGPVKATAALAIVADAFEIPAQGLRTKTYDREMVIMRSLAAYALYRHTSLTIERLARLFGYTGGPASVFIALKRAEKLILTPYWRETYEEAARALEGAMPRRGAA